MGFPLCQGPESVRGSSAAWGAPRGLHDSQRKQGGPRERPGGNEARAAQGRAGTRPLPRRPHSEPRFPSQDALWQQEVSNLSEWLSPSP